MTEKHVQILLGLTQTLHPYEQNPSIHSCLLGMEVLVYENDICYVV